MTAKLIRLRVGVIRNPHFLAKNGYILIIHPTDTALPNDRPDLLVQEK